MQKRLLGRCIAITGASSGIGRAAAVAMASEGADVALIARSSDKLAETAEAVREYGVRSVVIVADISVPQQAKAAIKAAIDELGRLDALYCNAGIYYRRSTLELTPEEIRRIMDVNFYGSLYCINEALPHMLDRGKGSIVVTCSMDGKKGVPPDAAYVASKFALNGYLQVLRQELRSSGVHVSTIFPARVDTPLLDGIDCPGVTPKIDPSLVADAAIRAILTGKKELYVPEGSCRMLVYADAVSPSLGDWIVRTFNLGGEQSTDVVNSKE